METLELNNPETPKSPKFGTDYIRDKYFPSSKEGEESGDIQPGENEKETGLENLAKDMGISLDLARKIYEMIENERDSNNRENLLNPDEKENFFKLINKLRELPIWFFKKFNIDSRILRLSMIPIIISLGVASIKKVNAHSEKHDQIDQLIEKNRIYDDAICINKDYILYSKYDAETATAMRNAYWLNDALDNFASLRGNCEYEIYRLSEKEYLEETPIDDRYSNEEIKSIKDIYKLSSNLVDLIKIEDDQTIDFETVDEIKETIDKILETDDSLKIPTIDDNWRSYLKQIKRNLFSKSQVEEWDLNNIYSHVQKKIHKLIEYFNSDVFFKRLLKQGFSPEQARTIVAIKTENIKNIGWDLNINETEIRGAYAEPQLRSDGNLGYGVYIDPQNENSNHSTCVFEHEGIHYSYVVDAYLPKVGSELEKNNGTFNTPESNVYFSYNKKSDWIRRNYERYASFVTLEFEMDRCNIKKINEPFTIDHYRALIKLAKDNLKKLEPEDPSKPLILEFKIEGAPLSPEIDYQVLNYLNTIVDINNEDEEVGYKKLKKLFDIVAYQNSDQSEKPNYSDPSISYIPDSKTTT